MECSKVQERLAGYLQDDLRLTERLIVEVHVSQCPMCHAEMEDVRETLVACTEVLRHPSPQNRYAELRAQLAAADRAAIVPFRKRIRPRRAAAAAGVAVAFLVIAGVSTPMVHRGPWFGSLEQAVDEAVREDMDTVKRASDKMNWNPAEEYMPEEEHGAGTVAKPPHAAHPAAYAPGLHE